MATTKDRLLEILDVQGRVETSYVNVRKAGSGYAISYGMMYEAPELNTDRLMRLVELFGTKKIDVDNYRNSGCESCDYGSDYGHEIEVMEPTAGLDLPEFTTRER